MNIYQWLVPILSLFFIYRIILQFKANKRLLIGTLFWVTFWIFIAFLSVFPDFVSSVLKDWFGFKDHINAVIFVALGFLFLITYYQSSTIENLEKQMTELIRKLALEKQKVIDLERKNKKSGQEQENIKKAN
ncbi:MAG: DUF2304 domain-containing protein [Saprospiraceae bacterium]|nr:DUF2304 domain-containing protein [Bacteroidia bacterium]NNE16272.1 DUF2304 domain-containing protein [Saprospiraceae bacterium]NNL91574.1 DUF2304 domain-containing protein [Saprospiraceae bacterium]